jgi:hypothetical protein
MRTTLRRNTIAVAAVAAVGAVAFASPGMAKGLFDASNAHKVDGYHAVDLTKTQYWQHTTVFDDFNSCSYEPVISKKFKTTHSGVVSVVSNVGAARDTNFAPEGILTTRILIDGVVASLPASVNLENDGTQDATSTAIGARKVGKGVHKLVVQAKECGPGAAFIHQESLVAQYSPFGAAMVSPDIKPVAAKNG